MEVLRTLLYVNEMPTQNYPEFALSHSRINALEECPLAYAFSYYHSYNGWQRNAHPDAQELYRLKQLGTLHAIVGTAIHEEARRFVIAVLTGIDLPRYSDVIDRLEASIVEAASKRDFFAFASAPKKHALLRSTYYDLAPAPIEVRLAREKAAAAARNLCQSMIWAEIACKDDYVFEAERRTSFVFEGTAVKVAIDLMGRGVAPEDCLLLDFKSSSDRNQDSTPQLALYAMLARSEGALYPTLWDVRAVNFLTGQEQVVRLDSKALAAAEHRLRSARDRMASYQSCSRENIPVSLEKFEMAAGEQRGTCIFQCPYLERCVEQHGLRV